MRRDAAVRVAGFGAVLLLAGCPWLQSASERGECDRALEIVCGCASEPCRDPSTAPAVGVLRRCDTGELTSGGMHLAACINEEAQYCEVLDGLVSGTAELCRHDCNTGCDLKSECERFQYLNCGLAPVDGGQR